MALISHRFINYDRKQIEPPQCTSALFKRNLLSEIQCCNNPLMLIESGFSICKNCGTVLDRVLDISPRRAFSQDEINKRKNNEPVYSPIGPRTIMRGNTDASGNMLPAGNQMKYHRLEKIHRSLTSSFERNLWIALPNFHRIVGQLGLSETVVNDALRIYSHAVKERLAMGRSIEILLSASIYASLNIHGTPRPLDEILKDGPDSKKKVYRAYRLIVLQILPKLKLRVIRVSPSQYLEKFTEELHLSLEVRDCANRIMNYAQSRGLMIEGKDPKGFAAGAIYLATKMKKILQTQTQIAVVSHTTEVTLRLRAKELLKFAKALC